MNKLYVIFLFLISLYSSYSQHSNLKHQVYFETDKFDVNETEYSRLLAFLYDIENLDIEKVSIYGFTDDRGSDDYNLILSQQRADAIKTVFSNNEFDESVITNVDGKGEVLLKVVKQEDIHKVRGLNRKVEIIVQPFNPPRKLEAPKEKLTTEEKLKGKLKAGDRIKLENILFKTGYSILLPESIKTLEDISNILVERKDVYFTIQGHVCCTMGSRDAIDRKTKKRNLSVARAKYIYDYMAKKGVSKRRMKFVGMRRNFPLGGEPKFDRRVEILVTYAEDKD
ncbi:flagellar motor protein MotB [Mangrovimonas yunxiaonensis]|uniref:Flagellar motor protein MotB n=1 Tax=Mangrovimonas yunxiaonensis TaxID=1197477 RepID=A0A084TKQ0_9FLAO|nr:OmpA family protein [Mangrovimonas yunxiaonensis]KFB01286.1 flagellar motor protein MotB [Mangrovimonas yunxiaonensis]MBR9756884.1 OmpA family protein [Algicola sp.]GGH37599.1 membrane protein [Mangrovimonas yunxiaonensis]